MLAIEKTRSGFRVDIRGELGGIEGSLRHRLGHARPWRLCFTVCSGDASALQGKTADFATLAGAQEEIHRLARALGGSETDMIWPQETAKRTALSSAAVAAETFGLPQTVFRDRDSAGWGHTNSVAGRLANAELWLTTLPSRYFA